MALAAIKSFFQEMGTFSRLQQPSPVAFFAEDAFSYLIYEGHLQTLLELSDQPIHYVTMDAKDPVLAKSEPRLRTFVLKKMAHQFLEKTKHPALVMTMPDLGAMHVARPAPATRCVYLFHALVSIHRQYREGAFDHYDDFFCLGEYHVRELERRFEMIGKPCPRLHQVGYPKLDRIHATHQSYQKKWPDRPTVLLAPSWHPGNLLESGGATLVESLLAQDFRAVVRPHPAFFASVYPKGQAVIAEVEGKFSGHPNFVLDRTMESELYFHEADMLVTDWSGAAYEYAFGTERPVLFMEVPPKISNPAWSELGIEPFEVWMRPRVGRQLSMDQASNAGTVVAEALAASQDWRTELATLRDSTFFNFGRSARVGGELLAAIAAESAASTPAGP